MRFAIIIVFLVTFAVAVFPQQAENPVVTRIDAAPAKGFSYAYYLYVPASFKASENNEKVRTLLDTVVPSNFVSLPLKYVQPHIFGTSLAEEKYLKNTKLYLAVSSDLSEAELISKAPFLIKVCSADHIEHLVRQALPGVQMIHTPKPPSSIPVKLNSQYFSLSQSGVAWEAIGRARNLAAYVPGDFPNPQLELVILLPEIM